MMDFWLIGLSATSATSEAMLPAGWEHEWRGGGGWGCRLMVRVRYHLKHTHSLVCMDSDMTVELVCVVCVCVRH